jgi:hypothetical protein
VRRVERLAEENRTLAGQAGFCQARIQRLEAEVKRLAPPAPDPAPEAVSPAPAPTRPWWQRGLLKTATPGA